MPLTLPKPLIPALFKAKVPVWLLAAAITAQYVVVQITQTREPNCSIRFERIHYSTSNKKNLEKDSVKLNLTTSCTQPQKYSEISARISTYENGRTREIYRSAKTRQNADAKKPTDAKFLEFWVNCNLNSVKTYRGEARGEVLLSNGRVIPVSGNTGEYLAVLCNYKAK